MGGNQKAGGAKRLRARRVALGVVALAPWVGGAQPATARADASAAVGACLITIDVTGGYGLTPPIAPTSLSINGDGTCVVNGDQGIAATIGGTAKAAGDTSTWTCAGGVAEGVLTFSVAHPDFPSGVNAALVMTAEAAVMTLVATHVDDDGDPAFSGSGGLVQDPDSLQACPTDSSPSKTSTWTGPFAFTYASAGALPPIDF